MPIVLVERTYPVSTAMDVDTIARSTRCYEARRIEHLFSFRSSDGSRWICVYRAPDAGSVREANDMARQPYDRVWTAQCIDTGGEPKEL